MSKHTLWGTVLCLVAAWFGFANPILHLPILVLGLPVSLCALAVHSKSHGQIFLRSWLAASLYFTAVLYWVSIPVHEYGYLPWVVALPCPLLLGLYLGIYPGIFSLVMASAWKHLSWPGLCLGAWSTWTALEYLRATLLTGFPWLSLAQAFAPWPVLLQGAAFIGAHGLSGFFAALGVCLYLAPQRPSAWLGVTAGIVLALTVGLWHMDRPLAGDRISNTFALVQGNIDQSRKWSPASQQQTVQRYLGLSQEALDQHGADFLIWPETAMPFYLQEDSKLSAQVRDFCRTYQVHVLTGAPGYTVLPEEHAQRVVYHNMASLIDPRGDVQDVYSKQHLVPFGEYVPFGHLFPFVNTLVAGVGNFRAGAQDQPIVSQDLAIGLLICYEVIFPGLVHTRVQDGANLLVNISNDAWFGHSSGAWQHFNQAVLRALEQGRYLLRSTNTGISAVIDPHGLVADQGPWFQPHIIALDTVRSIEQRTFFSRYRTAVSVAFIALALLACLWAARKPRT